MKFNLILFFKNFLFLLQNNQYELLRISEQDKKINLKQDLKKLEDENKNL